MVNIFQLFKFISESQKKRRKRRKSLTKEDFLDLDLKRKKNQRNFPINNFDPFSTLKEQNQYSFFLMHLTQ